MQGMSDFRVPEGGCYLDLRKMTRAFMAKKGLPRCVEDEETVYQRLRAHVLARGRVQPVYVSSASLPPVPETRFHFTPSEAGLPPVECVRRDSGE